MNNQRFVVLVFTFIMVTTLVSARAVNISNTWMLPEEGFPVFYRYFRDRISWYEADAVCQFHHANLVTADSSSQYDAIRAYLKELDITESVWIGLSKTVDRPNFTWTDFQPLSGDGHWRQAIPKSSDPFCVVMDPAADFLWEPMTCGGPDVASFICELPVPSWAMGPKGCLLTELPSLTVLYIPEQLALELTSDCGLDGTKRIACKGNADREEILKQLTCAISPDDFEDKSTKSSLSLNTATSTLFEASSEDNSFNSKTTKPWIWTSNTVDIDYGMPTRHRRETEDTISPSSTKSTTDLSVQESHSLQKSTTESDSKSTNQEDVIKSNAPRKLNKVEKFKTTAVPDLTTPEINTRQEQAEIIQVTVESKVSDATNEETGEFPSAIGQGQLFSIIENGTMFDIIELNETTSDDSKTPKNVISETAQTALKESTTHSTTINNDLYTTVVYHKEPPSETPFVTNKSVKKVDRFSKKEILKSKNSKKYQQNKLNDKTLSKEVELFPIETDSLVKLNRTHRKELPLVSDDEEKTEHEKKSFVNSNEMDDNKHQHIEIKWHHHEENTNVTQMKLFVTTKRLETNNLGSSPTKQNYEFIDEKEDRKIDSGIDMLNNNNNSVENNYSETFVPPKPEKMKSFPEDVSLTKEQYLPKSPLKETKTTSSVPFSNEPTEPEPEAQPRPNRQRQLTRPQRRSFYPYFFSRVLG